MFSSSSSQVSTAANYIEDVFSTYLYAGNGSTQTITNGIDLSTKGGLVWSKSRASSVDHALYDTARGNKFLSSNTINAQSNPSISGMSFTTTGYNLLGADGNLNNTSFSPYVSWTFRKQAKFFDVVSFSTDGSGAATFSHSLGSTPGCIFIKRTSGVEQWYVYHRSLTNPNNYYLGLNTTLGETNVGFSWITVSGTSCSINGLFSASSTYVAYLFAHDAGGFGSAGTDNVISCGSFTKSAGVEATITLGYEPQWLLFKRADAAENWFMIDNMRGMTVGGTDAYLIPNLSSAENNLDFVTPTATGFIATNNFNTGTYIYIAIRRGPMKTPTTGTSVFSAKTYVGTTTSAEVTHDVTFDAEISANRGTVVAKYLFVDSLRGINGSVIQSSSTAAEIAYPTYWSRKSQRTMYAPSGFDDWWSASSTNQNHISYGLVRAPGFFDVVCYTGTGANPQVTSHNLGVVPELVISKVRSNIDSWIVGYNFGASTYNRITLNSTGAAISTSYGAGNMFGAAPTATTLSWDAQNTSPRTYVTYLFATVAGVSKVGSYTGTAALQTINCGFSAGARFVLIKRTDSTGDWYVWDSARGISSGNDPYLLLNSTAAEVTGTNYVDTTSVGFQITAAAPAALNASGGSYIFLAVS